MIENQKKVVFFDIDGTIYDIKYGMPNDTKLAIKKLTENGHLPVICTGRTKAMIIPEIMNAGFEAIIAGGGTYIEEHGNVIYKTNMELKRAIYVIESLREYGFIPIPEGHDYIYFENANDDIMYNQLKNSFTAVVPQKVKAIDYNDIEVAKVSSIITKNSDITGLKNKLRDDYRYVLHSGQLLELMQFDNSKAEGIRNYICKKGIKWENTYAFGDSMNDYEMIKYVNYGIAMGNACEELKAAAKKITKAYNEGGVYCALQEYGLI